MDGLRENGHGLIMGKSGDSDVVNKWFNTNAVVDFNNFLPLHQPSNNVFAFSFSVRMDVFGEGVGRVRKMEWNGSVRNDDVDGDLGFEESIGTDPAFSGGGVDYDGLEEGFSNGLDMERIERECKEVLTMGFFVLQLIVIFIILGDIIKIVPVFSGFSVFFVFFVRIQFGMVILIREGARSGEVFQSSIRNGRRNVSGGGSRRRQNFWSLRTSPNDTGDRVDHIPRS